MLLSCSTQGKFVSCQLFILCWLFIAFFAFSGRTQVSRYTFQQSIGNYSEITGGTQVDTATSINSYDASNWVKANGTIPFPFMFNGELYSGFVINSNGYITFGATAPSASLNKPISASAAYRGAISAFGADLNASRDQGYTGGIRYETIGTPGSRIFVIQFKNWNAIYRNASTFTGSALINFQIRLHETSSIIEIIYGDAFYSGTYTNTTNSTAEIGLRGTSNTDFLNRTNTSATAFTSSSAGTTNSNTQSFNFSNALPGIPQSGLTYTFIPACVKPAGLSLLSAGIHEAEIGISIPTFIPAEGFEYELRTSGAAGSGSTGLAASGTFASSSLELENLTEGTSYSLYIRSQCAASDISAWSAEFKFKTKCSPAALPYHEGFNTTSIPSCWNSEIVSLQSGSKLSFVTSGTNPSATPYEGSSMVYYNSFSTSNGGSGSKERLISAPLTTIGVSSVDVEFYLYQHTLGTQNTGEGVRLQWSVDGINWNSEVFFPGYNAQTGWSRKLITLPAGAGEQPLLYVALQFESLVKYNLFVDNFTVSATPPSPFYTSLSNNLESCADSTLITVTGDVLENASLSVGGTVITNIVSNTRTEIRFYVPAGVNGTLTVTNNMGSFTTTEEINVHAIPQLTLSSTLETICQSDSTSVVSLTSAAADFDTYTWSDASLLTGNTINGYRFFPAASKQFTLTAVKDFGTYTCQNTTSLFVHVNNAPAVQLEQNTLSLCEGEIIELKTVPSPDALITYGGIETMGPNPACHLFGGYKQQTILKAYELRNMGLNAGDPLTNIAFKLIDVNPNALQGFSIKLKNTQQGATTYDFDVTGLTTVYSVAAYSPVTGFNVFNFDAPFSWDGTSNLLVEFAFSNNNSGGGNPNTTAEYVNTTYPATAYTYRDNTSFADIASSAYARQNVNKRNLLFFGTTQRPVQLPVYQWSGSASLYQDDQATLPLTIQNLSKVYYKVPANNEEVTVVVTDPSTGCTTSDAVQISSNPVFHTTITESVCDTYDFHGEELTTSGTYHKVLSSAITGCDSTITLNLTVNHSSTQHLTKIACGSYLFNGQTLTASGTYTANLQTSKGCDSTITLDLTINSVIEATVVLDGNELKALPTGTNYAYQWNNCNGAAIQGANSATYTPAVHGNYSVTISANGEGCTSVSACILYDINSTDEITAKPEFIVYPNPTSDQVTIAGPVSTAMTVRITELSGKIVREISGFMSGDQIDMSALESGVYVIHITTDTAQQTIRVSKK